MIAYWLNSLLLLCIYSIFFFCIFSTWWCCCAYMRDSKTPVEQSIKSYSRNFLLSLRNCWKLAPRQHQVINAPSLKATEEPLHSDAWNLLKSLGVLCNYRRKRAGRLLALNDIGNTVELPIKLIYSSSLPMQNIVHVQDQPTVYLLKYPLLKNNACVSGNRNSCHPVLSVITTSWVITD